MKKSDLRTGMKVKYRDGNIRMVLLGTAYGDGLLVNEVFGEFRFYNDDLTHEDDIRRDIMFVYETKNAYPYTHKIDNLDGYYMLWERQKSHTVTIDNETRTISDESFKAIKEIFDGLGE